MAMYTVDTCLHSYDLHVVDYSTATVVCSGCALVMMENYCHLYEYRRHESGHINSKHLSTSIAYCEESGLPLSLAADVAKMAQNLEKGHIMAKYISRQGLTKPRQNDLLAYCLYNVCKRHKCFRTLDEIEAITGCDRKRLWKLESAFGEHTDPDEYGVLIEKYCYYLQIKKYKDVLRLQKICIHNIRSLQGKPQTIIGACVANYCKNDVYYTDRCIAEIVSSTPKSIKKWKCLVDMM